VYQVGTNKGKKLCLTTLPILVISKEICQSHDSTGGEYEKIVCKVPTKESKKDQKYMCMMCQGNLQWLWHNRDRFFQLDNHTGWDVGSPFWPWDRAAVHAVEMCIIAASKKKKFRAQVLVGKVMNTIVGCYDGGLFGERSHYHRWLLLQLSPKPERFCCLKMPRKFVFWSPPPSWQCSAIWSANDSAKYAWMQIWTAAPPNYSPHLAPSYFSLFPKMKRHMCICHFETDDAVTDEMMQCCHTQEVSSSCFF